MDLLIPIVPVNQECVLARETTPDVSREPLINHLETNKNPARETDNFNTYIAAVLKKPLAKANAFLDLFLFSLPSLFSSRQFISHCVFDDLMI